jgi:hypothetical protein
MGNQVKDWLNKANSRKILGLPFFSACTAISWGASAGFFMTIFFAPGILSPMILISDPNPQRDSAMTLLGISITIGWLATFFMGIAFALAFLLTNPWSLISKHINSSIVLAVVVLFATVLVVGATGKAIEYAYPYVFTQLKQSAERIYVQIQVAFYNVEDKTISIFARSIGVPEVVVIDSIVLKASDGSVAGVFNAADIMAGETTTPTIDSTLTEIIVDAKGLTPQIKAGTYTVTIVSTMGGSFVSPSFLMP